MFLSIMPRHTCRNGKKYIPYGAGAGEFYQFTGILLKTRKDRYKCCGISKCHDNVKSSCGRVFLHEMTFLS